MNTLQDVLADSHIRSCGARYSEGLEARWDLQLKQLGKDRFIVPVVGVQGAGKSTLLTALLFDRPVLPVDADETTCVPVEIVYGTSNVATVQFLDGRSEQAQATEESLSLYVHQASNPGNKLGVARVVVESPSPILRSGVVLVDLPGLGSLTKANAETTHSYLNDSSGLIYLLRTVPPMTKSESLSLSLIWPSLPIVFFAQNRWTDESDEEAAGGRDHNAFVIGDLAKRLGRTSDGAQQQIDVVCAYRALAGVLTGDAALVTGSGIKAFEAHLTEAFTQWPVLRASQLTSAVRADLEGCRGTVQGRIADLGTDRSAARQALESEFGRQASALAMLGERIRTVKEHLDAFTRDRRDATNKWRSDSRSELRNRMRTLMRKGIVDGSRLDKALVDEQCAVGEAIYEDARTAVLDVMSLVGKDLAGDWTANTVSGQGVGTAESTRYENFFKPVAGAAGALGGAWAGAQGGAIVGTMIGGPVGTAVGFLIGGVGGMLGGMLGSWVGQQVANSALADRAKASEPEVFRAIDEYTDAVVKGLSESAARFSDSVHDNLRAWHAEARRRAEIEHVSRRTAIDGGDADRAAAVEALQKDLGCLEAALSRLATTLESSRGNK
jgi:hypothetical protein